MHINISLEKTAYLFHVRKRRYSQTPEDPQKGFPVLLARLAAQEQGLHTGEAEPGGSCPFSQAEVGTYCCNLHCSRGMRKKRRMMGGGYTF